MKKLSLLSIAAGLALVGCAGSGSNVVTSSGKIGLWTTTNVKSGAVYVQQDRLANPVVNEVFATFANNRHKVNNTIAPTKDKDELANDIQSFMTRAAGRSQATTDVIKAIFNRDIMIADLSKPGRGAYLGVQTGGATGSMGGGRELTDDVVDISLGAVFGTTVSALGLAPDDGKAIPALTSDNVGPGGKRFTSTFPYLGAPR
ncbi:MAG: DUF4331 family protein [Fimbriimonadaceae bacterium]